MIRPLRKRHLYSWIVIAILLVVGFNAAYFVIPEYPTQPLQSDGLLPERFNHSIAGSRAGYHLSINEDTTSGRLQVDISPIRILHPSLFLSVALINEAGEPLSNETDLIGTIAEIRRYRFNLPGKYNTGTPLNLYTAPTDSADLQTLIFSYTP